MTQTDRTPTQQRQYDLWALQEFVLWAAAPEMWEDKPEQALQEELLEWREHPQCQEVLARTGWLEAYQALIAAEVTLPAMQRFATRIVAALSTPELHELAQQLDYDCGGEWLAGLIVQQPTCDIETARHLYWALDPAYGHWSHAPADAYYSDSVVAIWQAIEHRLAEHATPPFRRDLPRSNMRAEWVPEAIPNFALSPWCHIPAELQF